jgi:hypothetical protein
LADAAFDAEGVELFPTSPAQGAESFDLHGRTLGMERVEFFFAGRTGR